MSLVVGQRASLVDEAVENIRDFIDDQELSPGDRLPTESSLVEQLGVSRTVLREAVTRLTALGLIAVRRGSGMFVGDRDGIDNCIQLASTIMAISERELKYFADFRCAMECHSARRAATVATRVQLAELEDLLGQLGGEHECFEEAISQDFEFHRKVAEIAGNPLILQLMSMLQRFIVREMSDVSLRPRDDHFIRKVHEPILDAIKNRDPEGAAQAMLTHMEVFSQRVLEVHPCDYVESNNQDSQ